MYTKTDSNFKKFGLLRTAALVLLLLAPSISGCLITEEEKNFHVREIILCAPEPLPGDCESYGHEVTFGAFASVQMFLDWQKTGLHFVAKYQPSNVLWATKSYKTDVAHLLYTQAWDTNLMQLGSLFASLDPHAFGCLQFDNYIFPTPRWRWVSSDSASCFPGKAIAVVPQNGRAY